jgi:hypothetical protein
MLTPWMRRIGFVALVEGLCLADYGLQVTPAAAEPPIKESALPGITQNWDKNLPSASRFTVLADFGGAAVQDNNTGLVWEQAPDTGTRNYAQVTLYCANKNVGGAVGWRLPSVIELKSVQDPLLPPPFVPTSIFTSIQSNRYWSATTFVDTFGPVPNGAWGVHFDIGVVNANNRTDGGLFAWCVRGPMNADAY